MPSQIFFRNSKTVADSVRSLSTSGCCRVNQKWRQERGLPINANAYGVLTDKADYSYLDGKPTPVGVRQRNRLLKQKEIAEKIITLTKEMDFAVERHRQMQIEADNIRKAVLDSKLKPKGEEMYKK